MTEYSLSELGLQEHELCLGLGILGNNTYTYDLNFDNPDIIVFRGKIHDPDAPLPNPVDIKNAYDQALSEQMVQRALPKLIHNNVTTKDNSFRFVSCCEGNACVTIPKGSNSIATVVDPTKMENVVVVNDDEFMSALETLPLKRYTLPGQPLSSQRIGCTGDEWNNVFNFESKDPTLQNIELMDMIGVLLATVKNLNHRIKVLESQFQA